MRCDVMLLGGDQSNPCPVCVWKKGADANGFSFFFFCRRLPRYKRAGVGKYDFMIRWRRFRAPSISSEVDVWLYKDFSDGIP